MIKVGIIGASGYTGGELIRILINHSKVAITFAYSRNHYGKKISTVHPDLVGESDLVFTNRIELVDILFLCLSHGESKSWLIENTLSAATNVIDLGNDFRLDGTFSLGNFVYGLPELQKEAIKKAKYIANPGCFATNIQLALLPLANESKIKSVYTTGITGSTGAGMGLSQTSHFSWRVNNISAYKTLTHQHVPEILKTLEACQNEQLELNFVPWRGDFTRGIYSSSVLESDATLDHLYTLYRSFYKVHPFVHVSEEMIDLKQVVNTNKCLLHIEKQGNKVVIHSVIDNLLKGASGQAVQNMNLMFGFEETLGLHLKANAF